MGRSGGTDGSAADAHGFATDRGVRRRLMVKLGSAAALVTVVVVMLILATGSGEVAVRTAHTGSGEILSEPAPEPIPSDPIFDTSTNVPPSAAEVPASAATPAAEVSASPSTSRSDTTVPDDAPSEKVIPYGCDYFPPCDDPGWVDPGADPTPPPPTFPPAPPVEPEDLPAAFEELVTSFVDLNALAGQMFMAGDYLYDEVRILGRFVNADGTSVPISDELRAVIESSAAPITVTFVSEAPDDDNGAFVQFAEPIAEGNAFWFTGRIDCDMCQFLANTQAIAVAKEADGCWHLDYYWHSFIYGSEPMC